MNSSPSNILTHSYLEIYLGNVVWTCHNFGNIFEIKDRFIKYLMKNCRYKGDEQVSFKYILNIAFVREISAKQSGGLAAIGMNGLKISLTSVIWTFDIFRNNFENKHKFKKYFKESSGLGSDGRSFFKMDPEKAMTSKILLKLSGLFGHYQNERVKHLVRAFSDLVSMH